MVVVLVLAAVQGSVAEQILRTSEIPVLIVNAHAREPREAPPLRRVLVALDRSLDRAAAALASLGLPVYRANGIAITLALIHI